MFARTTRFSLLALGIAGALAIHNDAHAAAFQLNGASAKGQGTSFAGEVSAPGDAAIIAVNPAGMIGLKGQQLQADASVISFGARFHGDATYSDGSTVSGGNGGNAGTVIPVPAIYYHLPIGDNQHFGASLNVPFGFTTEYDRDWVGRYAGVKTKLQAIDFTLAYSYDVNPYVSFGANVFAERLDIDFSQAIDFASAINGILGSQALDPGSADGYLDLKGHNTAVGFTLGGLFSPSEHSHIGISYRSKVDHKITNGKASFNNPADGNYATLTPNATANALISAGTAFGLIAPGSYTDTGGKATVTMPAVGKIGFTQDINEQWTWMVNVSRSQWSSAFDDIVLHYDSGQDPTTLKFGYRDTTMASLGAEYRFNPEWTWRFGVAWDQTPTTLEYRDVRVPDPTRKWASLGFTWTPSQNIEWTLGYTHLFVSKPPIDENFVPGQNADGSDIVTGTLQGEYKVDADVLALGFNWKF